MHRCTFALLGVNLGVAAYRTVSDQCWSWDHGSTAGGYNSAASQGNKVLAMGLYFRAGAGPILAAQNHRQS